MEEDARLGKLWKMTASVVVPNRRKGHPALDHRSSCDDSTIMRGGLHNFISMRAIRGHVCRLPSGFILSLDLGVQYLHILPRRADPPSASTHYA